MTSTHESNAPVDVPTPVSNKDFALRQGRIWALAVLVFLVIVLAAVVLRTSDKAINRMDAVSDIGSTTGSAVIVQRESLAFVIGYEQWLSGIIALDDLLISRDLLAQRLAVRDNTGVVSRERVRPEYLQALGALDDFVQASPPGLLAPEDQSAIRASSADALQSFIFESRQLVALVAGASDERTRQLMREDNTNRINQYQTVLLLLALMCLCALYIFFSRNREYKKIRVRLVGERQSLDKLKDALQQVDSELQMRIEKERVDRIDREWVDTGVESILALFRASMTFDAITELTVEGLGRVLRADSVISYSFATLSWPAYSRQWNKQTDSPVDGSYIPEYESRLFTYVNRLWSEERVTVVNDSNHIEITPDRIPEIVEITRQWARSWVVVPFGEGTRATGFVLVAMVESARVWSAAEIELIKKVSVAAGGACTQALLFKQSMQLVENDAEVGRLVELDRVKNDFIANMNHELRSPLTSIVGYLEVALEGVDADTDPALASSLAVVQRNALRLQVLMENMIQISKRDFEHLPLAVAMVDVGRLLDDGVNSLHPSATTRAVNMTLRLDSPASELIIEGDSSQLDQVFVNLISNAIKFTPRGGTVTVVASRAHAEGEYVEVQVADTGIGIPTEEFPNVFKRFFRASTATQAAIPGYGIGLSLVQSIVREHHGTITFDSIVGKGTVFTVKLPLRYNPTKRVDQTI